LDYIAINAREMLCIPILSPPFVVFLEIEVLSQKKRLQQPLPIATGAFSSLLFLQL
jgi:hypothetical protein